MTQRHKPGPGLNILPIRGNVDTRIRAAPIDALDQRAVGSAGRVRRRVAKQCTSCPGLWIRQSLSTGAGVVPSRGRDVAGGSVQQDGDVRAEVRRGDGREALAVEHVGEQDASKPRFERADCTDDRQLPAGCYGLYWTVHHRGLLLLPSVPTRRPLRPVAVRWSAPSPRSRWRPPEHRAPVPFDHGPWSRCRRGSVFSGAGSPGPPTYPGALGERLADTMLSAGAQTLMGNR